MDTSRTSNSLKNMAFGVGSQMPNIAKRGIVPFENLPVRFYVTVYSEVISAYSLKKYLRII